MKWSLKQTGLPWNFNLHKYFLASFAIRDFCPFLRYVLQTQRGRTPAATCGRTIAGSLLLCWKGRRRRSCSTSTWKLWPRRRRSNSGSCLTRPAWWEVKTRSRKMFKCKQKIWEGHQPELHFIFLSEIAHLRLCLLQITLTTSWKEVKKVIKDDPRCIKFSSSDRVRDTHSNSEHLQQLKTPCVVLMFYALISVAEETERVWRVHQRQIHHSQSRLQNPAKGDKVHHLQVCALSRTISTACREIKPLNVFYTLFCSWTDPWRAKNWYKFELGTFCPSKPFFFFIQKFR